MFKEFNVKFEDAEIIGGADNLLEGTGVTKVILRGDNKLSSLDSTFKNCSQLDTIDGELNLDGISDVDSLLEGTNLVTSIDLKNVNNKDITANNAFSHVNQINIGGETYNKEAIQNILSSREWTFNNVNYIDTVGEDVVTHTPFIAEEDENTQIVINDALEQKVRDIEIKGQTYQNLIQGKEGAELLADIKLESIDGSPSELEPPIDHPVCVEVIEGQTYQNLIQGKGEYNLTDTYNATWTESNNSFEDMPNMIEIPEIFGNTVQDEKDLNIIQSVGDLYVNEEGNPILDEEGNEQYKLEIETYSNGNLFLNDNVLKFKSNSNWDIIKDSSNSFTTTQKIRQNYLTSVPIILPKGEYTFRGELNSGRCDSFILYLNGKSIYTTSWANINVEFVVDKHSEFYFSFRNYSEAGASNPVSSDFTFNLVRGNLDEYVNTPSSSNKTTILMPQPLRKVGEYSEKLYWDYNKNKFLMDIGTQIVKATTNPNYVLVKESDEFVTVSLHHNYLIGMEGTGSFCSLLSQIKSYNATEEGFCYVAPLFYFTLRKNKLDNSTVGYALAVRNWLVNNNATFICPKKSKTIETKVLEKPSLETYSPKTYISTNTEVQPSQMTITNKRNLFLPLGLQANKDYTLQLDSIGKDDKPITVNLGGSEITTQPVNDTSKHHKVVIKTPTTLTTDKLELSGEGVVVNDVMLFEGGEDIIKQEVEYIEGIQSIGELQEDGTYKIDILTNNGNMSYSKQSILLPQSLNKIGNVADKLYWDEDKGHYCIEQKICKIILNGSESWGEQSSLVTDICYMAYLPILDSGKFSGLTYLNDKFAILGSSYGEKLDKEGMYTAWGGLYINVFKSKLSSANISGFKQWLSENPVTVLYVLEEPIIIDLPHLNKKYSLDTYMPTTYLECSNSPIQPSRMYFETDKLKYKPLALETNKDYTIQFECSENSDTNVKVVLGGVEEEIQAVVGTNHINITTPAELSSNRLYISGQGNKVSEVMLIEGDMKQYPNYFDGVQSVGVLQDDGTYKIDIKTNEDFIVSIKTDLPLSKDDKLYWNDTNKRYEIDRSGEIEIPTVEGDIIDLPRLYQREDTVLTVECGNIKPSEIKIEYKNLN